jgi:phospholipase C
MAFLIPLAVTASLLISLAACGGGSAPNPGAPDFQVTASALTPSAVLQGGSATSTVTVAPINGFNATVALSCTGTLPTGASCAFNPSSIPATGSSQLTVSSSASSVPGTYPVTVTATSGSTNHGAPVTLVVQTKIQHVVVIFQENRTPDNLFHDQNLINAGADIASTGLDSKGNVLTLTPVPMVTPYDLGHKHQDFVLMYDNGKMDGADLILVECPAKQPNCAPPDPQFQYVQASDVQPYFTMAETYTFADRMFQTNQGPSFPAHQYIISGTSAPAVGSPLFAAEIPTLGGVEAITDTGCTSPPAEVVALIDPQGQESSQTFPCFEHPTLTDELDQKSISWKYYTLSAGSIWTGPNAIKHMCVPNSSGTQCTGSDWTNNVVLNQTQVLNDIAANQLPSVTWVIPDGQESDHARDTDGSGPSWVSSIVNAIGNGPYWANTAIFITWDDWGGWYDHVAPTVRNSYEVGFRVPMIVVSPYAKAAYISHVQHDFGSILNYIEKNWGLASLGYADATADDFSDCFNYNQTPLTFKTIPAPMNAQHFLEDKSPPKDPDDD